MGPTANSYLRRVSASYSLTRRRSSSFPRHDDVHPTTEKRALPPRVNSISRYGSSHSIRIPTNVSTADRLGVTSLVVARLATCFDWCVGTLTPPVSIDPWDDTGDESNDTHRGPSNLPVSSVCELISSNSNVDGSRSPTYTASSCRPPRTHNPHRVDSSDTPAPALYILLLRSRVTRGCTSPLARRRV